MTTLWLPPEKVDHGFDVTICACEPGPYVGARKAGTPCCCEVCGFMVREQYDAIRAAKVRVVPTDIKPGDLSQMSIEAMESRG